MKKEMVPEKGSERAREQHRRHGRFGIATLWVLKLALALAVIIWAIANSGVFWLQRPIERVAMRVLETERFRREAITGLLPQIDLIERSDLCRAPALRSAAIARFWLASEVMEAGERERIDSSLTELRNVLRRSLACSPADPFLWVVLLWAENTILGFSPDRFTYLRISYEFGPNEGWIALKRNRVALSLFEQLPPDVAQSAENEFTGILESGFDREAAAIFLALDQHTQNILLLRLKQLPEANRQAFAQALYNEGYDVDVPGVRRLDPRPWR